MKHLYRLFSIILIASVLFTGCRATKEVAKKPTKQDIELLKQAVLDEPAFKTINSKMEFRIYPKEGVSAGMKGSLKLSRDSCMIISLQPFAGIEIVRCLIRPDSIFVVNKLQSLYSAESIDKVPYPDILNYKTLESIVTNRIFIPGKKKAESGDLDKFMSYKGKEGQYYSIVKDSFNISYHFDKDQQYNNMKVGTENILKALEVNYSMFERSNAGVFPRMVELQTENSGKKLRVSFLFMEPSYDKKTDFRFPVSSKYEKVSMKEMIEKFSNML